jgi:hypothetical protein
MILLFFVILLIIFLAGFLGLDFGMDVRILGSNPFFASVNQQTGIPLETIKNLMGIGVLFCEFVIILFTMLDRIGDTLRESIKPLVRLFPFGLFIITAWNIFSPIILALLPTAMVAAVTSEPQMELAQAISNASSTPKLLLSLGAMFLFMLTNYALGRVPENPEIRNLRAENARLKKELRRGI